MDQSIWIPPDLASACATYTTITTCAPSTFLFLQLVVNLYGKPDVNFGFTPSDHFQQFTQEPNEHFFNQGHSSGSHRDSRNFDFIVVGAGSAGCVVANRLSEIHDWRVLLLEAGPEEPKVTGAPAFAPLLQRSSIDWGYMTQPSPNSCLARPQGRCAWARGKVMGGSSAINFLIYIRGHPQDYDDWSKMGNPGWSYHEVLPYFIKSEHNANPELVKNAYHGSGGYLNVEVYPYQDKNIFPILDAYRELGLEELDQNGKQLIGTMLLQNTVKDGVRASTNRAFIQPIRNKRKNLVVRTLANVVRVLIDPNTKKAYGVEYMQNGKTQSAFADKEVILSAGAINSPKILMLSGVGPKEHLQSHGIHVIQNLRVGFNLQDHTTIDGVLFALSNKSSTNVDDNIRNSDAYLFKQTHHGPLSSTGPLQLNAMVQTKYESSKDLPDIQYSLDAASYENFITDPILTAQTNVNPLSYYTGLMLRPILLSPKSRGVVQLNNTDPVFGDPLIHANTFFEKIDLLRIVEGIKQGLNLLRTKSMAKLGAQLVAIPLPACAHLPYASDEYWACVAMSYTTTIFHPVGTCKMGPKTDHNAVVDSKLRVHEISNLRVIDASIMPVIIRGNTNAPVIMIAERASDFIKEDWLHLDDSFEDKEPFNLYRDDNYGFEHSWGF